MTINLEKLEINARALVSAAMKAGADKCDVVVANGNSLGIGVREGKVENTGRAEGDEFSLRVFVGKRTASVSANQPGDFAMLAERAVAMARVSPEDPFQDLVSEDELAKNWPDLDTLDNHIPDADELTARALEAENAALSVDGVSKSMGASAGWGTSGFVLATSNGFAGNYSVSRFSSSASALCGEGEAMERDYDMHAVTHIGDLRDPAEIGRTAGERAVRRSNPKTVKSGSYPLVFDRRIAGGMLGALLGAINASSVARKTSFLRNSMGKAVANPAVTVHDDPHRIRGLGSRPFDGEGRECGPLLPIDRGELTTWLLDGATARELGLESNGRASRSGSGTSPSSTNAWIEAGEKSPEDFMREIGTGILITETIGHGINMVTGDFSKGASGFFIENGEIAYPVAGFTIAGNLKDMFLSMLPASDLEFRGSTNAPSLLIEGMTVGGT